jgi:hypothetical protein
MVYLTKIISINNVAGEIWNHASSIMTPKGEGA